MKFADTLYIQRIRFFSADTLDLHDPYGIFFLIILEGVITLNYWFLHKGKQQPNQHNASKALKLSKT